MSPWLDERKDERREISIVKCEAVELCMRRGGEKPVLGLSDELRE
jgi:hypothetical protein